MTSRGALARVWGSTLLLAAATAGALPTEWPSGNEIVHPSGPAVVRASTAALLLSGQTGGELPIAARASVSTTAEDRSSVIVQVELDPRELADSAAAEPVDLGLFVYLFDDTGAIAASSTQEYSFDPPRLRAAAEAGGLIFRSAVELPAGRYRVGALVREVGQSRFGVASSTIDPDAFAGGSVVWGMEARSGWLLAMPQPVEALASQEPAEIEGEIYLPAALPAWVPGERALLRVELPSGSSADSLEASLASGDGTATASLPELVEVARTDRASGREQRLVSIRIPRLPEGRYELTVRRPGSSDRPGSRLPVLVLSPLSGERVSWMDSGSGLLLQTADPAVADPSGATVDLTALASGYGEVVDALLLGDRRRALDQLNALEATAHDGGYEAIRWLERSQLSTATSLARAHDLLPALFLLHYDQAAHYRSSADYLLAEHSLRLCEQISGLIARRAANPEDSTAAAIVSALVGDLLFEAGRIHGAQRAWDEALTLDPELVLALAGTARSFEQTGRYDEAVEALRRLVEIDGDDHESLLRLGVNLGRTRREAEAVSLLDEVATSDAEPWIRIVATQEAARLTSSAGQPDDALRRLNSAERTWPESQTIKVFKAHLLDRRNRSREAEQLMAELASSPAEREIAARHRYSRRPTERLDEARQRLVTLAGGRLQETPGE